MKYKIIYVSIFFFLILAGLLIFIFSRPQQEVKTPPFILPKLEYIQKNSIINIPIMVKTKEIEQVILNRLNTPLASGTSKKLTAGIFATKEINSAEFMRLFISPSHPVHYYKMYKENKYDVLSSFTNSIKLWSNPIHGSYKYISQDMTSMLDNIFKVRADAKYTLHLENFQLQFEGSQIKIQSSFKANLLTNYEQAFIPFGPQLKLKKIAGAEIQADVSVVGDIYLNDASQLVIKIPSNGASIKLTSIFLPNAIKKVEFLKFPKAELYLAEKFLEKEINKYLVKQIQKQITNQQINLKLKDQMQSLLTEYSQAISLSKNVWLLPEPKKILFSQIRGEGKGKDNKLYIDIGMVAQPKIITSDTKPKPKILTTIPIVHTSFKDKIYLYPNIEIKYDYLQKTIKQELNSYISKKIEYSHYKVSNVTAYPSDTNLVITVALKNKNNPKETFSFHLWGKPAINTESKKFYVKSFDLTLDSKNILLEAADWLIAQEIKELVHKKITFNYEEKLNNVSQITSTIKYPTKQGLLEGCLHSIEVNNISLSEDAIVIYTQAKGNMVYSICLQDYIQ